MEKKLRYKLYQDGGIECHLMMYGNVKVSIAYLPKLIAKLTASVLHKLNELGGSVRWMDGKNVIVFSNKKQVEDAIGYLESIIVMDKLTNK